MANTGLLVSWSQGKEGLNVKGHEEYFGVMEIFYILIMMVVT